MVVKGENFGPAGRLVGTLVHGVPRFENPYLDMKGLKRDSGAVNRCNEDRKTPCTGQYDGTNDVSNCVCCPGWTSSDDSSSELDVKAGRIDKGTKCDICEDVYAPIEDRGDLDPLEIHIKTKSACENYKPHTLWKDAVVNMNKDLKHSDHGKMADEHYQTQYDHYSYAAEGDSSNFPGMEEQAELKSTEWNKNANYKYSSVKHEMHHVHGLSQAVQGVWRNSKCYIELLGKPMLTCDERHNRVFDANTDYRGKQNDVRDSLLPPTGLVRTVLNAYKGCATSDGSAIDIEVAEPPI
jgi:hypothetical protein